MLRIALAQLRRRPGRSLALLLGVLIATTGFTVLTASTETSRLQVTGTVADHSRGVYDILVRPSGAHTELEQQHGLVRPNFLAGTYGGITADQWQQIADLPGVEIAAPIAMLGYTSTYTSVRVDITDAVDPSASRQLIEVRPQWQADRGLTQAPDDATGLVYVTTAPTVWPADDVVVDLDEQAPIPYTDGVERPGSVACGQGSLQFGVPYEQQDDGEMLPICSLHELSPGERPRTGGHVAQLTSTGEFIVNGEHTDRLRAQVAVPMPLLVAAIDPAAEAALVGLDDAITDGRYLEPDESVLPFQPPAWLPGAQGDPMPPVLIAEQPVFDEQVGLATRQLDLAGAAIAGQDSSEITALASELPGTEAASGPPVDITDGYQPELWDGEHSGTGLNLETRWLIRQLDPVEYEQDPAGELRPVPQSPAAESWNGDDETEGLENLPLEAMPLLAHDTGFRELQARLSEEVFGILDSPVAVGVFDQNRLTGVDELVGVPLETYRPMSATGGDHTSTTLLDDQQLLPNSNPGGYLTAPPSVLMALSTLPEEITDQDPISAVRVRVAGVTGVDDLSREHVRVVAEQITTTTGLDVDILLGSSPAPQSIALPAGELGRPHLTLTENWSQKGVAVAIIQAADRKSLILFGLILVVCALFITNATAAAIRDRRAQLATLACLGWSRRHLAATTAAEIALIAAIAGAISTAAAAPLGQLLGLHIPLTQAALAGPVALALALLAAAGPVWQASRTHPGAAIHPPASDTGTSRRRRTILALAATNLRRTPARTVLAALALAVGVGGLTLVLAVTWAFRGIATGSLIGDAVSLQVRTADTAAVTVTLLLGLAATVDVLYLNVRERAAELATLRATGWSETALSRLIIYEGTGIGLLGATAGATAGLAAAWWFTSELPPGLLWSAAGAAGGGVILASLSALAPALLQRRIPMSVHLAVA